MKKIIEEKLVKVFRKSGIYILDENKNDVLNLSSMQIVNILLLIEEELLLFLFEEDIDFLSLKTFNDYNQMISRLISEE